MGMSRLWIQESIENRFYFKYFFFKYFLLFKYFYHYYNHIIYFYNKSIWCFKCATIDLPMKINLPDLAWLPLTFNLGHYLFPSCIAAWLSGTHQPQFQSAIWIQTQIFLSLNSYRCRWWRLHARGNCLQGESRETQSYRLAADWVSLTFLHGKRSPLVLLRKSPGFTNNIDDGSVLLCRILCCFCLFFFIFVRHTDLTNSFSLLKSEGEMCWHWETMMDDTFETCLVSIIFADVFKWQQVIRLRFPLMC